MDAPGRIAVIGAGAMGSGIAQVAATAGHLVHLVDAVDGAAERAQQDIAARLDERVGRGRMTQAEADETVARLLATATVADLPECALVIEAVKEDLAVKQALFAEVAAHQPATTVLASNTSSLDVDEIAEAVPAPERVIGLHFFNPAPVMALVEVVGGRRSATAYLDFGAHLVRGWGKTPVRCASTPGFVVNRVARPFYGEAQRMLAAEVADASTLDAALRGAGFRLGPLELTDLIGQDVNLAVGRSVWEQTGRDAPLRAPPRCSSSSSPTGTSAARPAAASTRMPPTAPWRRSPPTSAASRRSSATPLVTDPVARTLAMLVNEAVDLVHRGEASEEDVDLAMRLGAGYPRGIIEWGREIGFDVVARQLAELDEAFPGGRYRPSPALAQVPS